MKRNLVENPVSYVDQIETVEGNDYKEEACQILSRKLKCWDYEKEIRFMKEIDPKSSKSKYVNFLKILIIIVHNKR